MNNLKMLILMLLPWLITPFSSLDANAQCSKRQLQKVCNSCYEQALNSSQCSSQISPTFAANKLKSSYRLTASVIIGRQEIYDISIINIVRDQRGFNFTYDASQASRLLSTRSAGGYSNYDTVVFWLPLDNAGLKTIACAGQIDASGSIEGGCGGITIDGLLTRKYGGNFTAIPLN
jgi:hypothetical protein